MQIRICRKWYASIVGPMLGVDIYIRSIIFLEAFKCLSVNASKERN